jgi:hypothetical protein
MKIFPLKWYCTIVIITSMSFAFYSCKKSTDTGTTEQHIFTWTHNGVTSTTTTDTAYVNNRSLAYIPYTIMAGYPRLTNFISKRVEFNLTSFNAGTYTFSAAATAPNKLSFVDVAGNDLTGISGTLTITANTNNRISGSFSATVMDVASVTSQLTGNFSYMHVVP